MTPASTLIVLLTGSMQRTRFSLVSDSTSTAPESSGVAPPDSPVLPPCGTTGTRRSRHQAITAATSCAVSGCATAMARPVHLPRQSVRNAAISAASVCRRPLKHARSASRSCAPIHSVDRPDRRRCGLAALEARCQRRGGAHQQSAVHTHGDEARAQLDVVAGQHLVGAQNAGRLAGPGDRGGWPGRWRRALPGVPGWPRWPIEADRSDGPMNTPSTPSTAAIASTCANACRVSTCTSRHTRSLASCR